jgi:ABC-type transporter Mla subunit MlaD
MASQEFGSRTPAGSGSSGPEKTQTSKSASNEAFANVTDAARDASTKIKETVSETASAATDHLKDLLDKQIGNHISAVGLLAGSMKRAADEIEEKSPLAAGLVRGVSDRIEEFAQTYEDETVEQLVRSASDFTRRQPALVFALAAFAGFLAFRTIKSAPGPTQSPSIQPNVGARV